MKINNLTINADVIDIISELKTQLSEQGINLFGKYFDSGDDVMVCCPYHKDGQERKPSAGIRKSDGLFHCLACGETHSLPEVISYCFNWSDASGRKGLKWLIENFVTLDIDNRPSIQLNFKRNEPESEYTQFYVPEDELDTYRYIHPYMYKRGLTDEIIEKFDIGYDKATDSITFPVRDLTGRCLFVARRSVKTKQFNFPLNVDKPLYGLYELSQSKCKELYVCEGMFDCLRFWVNGKCAVAGLGCLFNALQFEQLNKVQARHLIIATDNDDAGEKAARRILDNVSYKLVTRAIFPENRKDPGECTDEEIRNLKETWL